MCGYSVEGSHTVQERLMRLWRVLVVLRQWRLVITVLLRLMIDLLLKGSVCLRVNVLLVLCGRWRSAKG